MSSAAHQQCVLNICASLQWDKRGLKLIYKDISKENVLQQCSFD